MLHYIFTKINLRNILTEFCLCMFKVKIVLERDFNCIFVCQGGTVTCHPQPCPPLNCRAPQKVPGACCPVCQPEACEYRGRRYFDGEMFASLENECEDCRCEAGEVHCKVRSCQPHSCKHPARDRCCPRCHDCDYRNKLYRHNEKFVSPDDVCQNCQCRVSDTVLFYL